MPKTKAKKKRYRKRTEAEKIKILEKLDALPWGKQRAYLKKMNLTTSHIRYWRAQYGY